MLCGVNHDSAAAELHAARAHRNHAALALHAQWSTADSWLLRVCAFRPRPLLRGWLHLAGFLTAPLWAYPLLRESLVPLAAARPGGAAAGRVAVRRKAQPAFRSIEEKSRV